MQRWLEEFELKHLDFIRAIKSHYKMYEVWTALSKKTTDAGSAAFARRQSFVYYDLHVQTKEWFLKTAEPRFLNITEETIVETIQQFRADELGWLAKYEH